METVKTIDPAEATGKARELFAAAAERVGGVPNMLRIMGHSPELLGAYLALNRDLPRLSVLEKLRILIAAAVAAATGCEYGVSFARMFAKRAGVPDQEFDLACRGQARDPRAAAALRFAAAAVEAGGHVPAAEVEALRREGFGDREVIEIIGLVCVNVFRSYFNLLAGTPLETMGDWAPRAAAVG